MKAKQSGFTLLEMMFTIALLAVIVGVGVPNLRDFVRNSRMTAAANDIVTDFNLARSEAVKRRVPVTLCKSQDLANCDDDDAEGPFNSWIVFVDDADPAEASAFDGNGQVDTVDGVDEVVLRQRTLPDTITVLKRADQLRVTFLPSGFPETEAARIERLLLCDVRGNVVGAGGDSTARAIEIFATGRPNVYRAIATVTAFESDATIGACP
jgi:type IV fimbrial biogenesis protein FimT